jgi:hypothetical protein
MPITICLHPDTEDKLRRQAAQSGQTVDRFIEQVLERALHGPNGGPELKTASPPGAEHPAGSLPSDEALAPFRREVTGSGMSEEELRAFFENVREEVYREKQGPPGNAS